MTLTRRRQVAHQTVVQILTNLVQGADVFVQMIQIRLLSHLNQQVRVVVEVQNLLQIAVAPDHHVLEVLAPMAQVAAQVATIPHQVHHHGVNV
jgi:hypothetical protein